MNNEIIKIPSCDTYPQTVKSVIIFSQEKCNFVSEDMSH